MAGSWLALALGVALAATPPVMRDAATHQDLVARKRATAEPGLPLGMTPCKGPDPSKANQPGDLIGRSDLVCHGGVATLVPKRALLSVPERFRQRLRMVEGTRVVTWEEFFARNRDWITTVEVTPEEAGGRAMLPEKTTRQIADCDTVVVATFLGGPISVLEYQPAPTAGLSRK